MTAELVDGAVERRVLVFGSPPPGGRDLDLLARPPEAAAIAARLAQEGFERAGVAFARFRDDGAEAVDLVPADEWGIEPVELEAVFAEALPLPGLERLVRPAPHHALLVAARRFVRGDGHLRGKLRARVDQALAEDSAALEHARARAPRWRSSAALALLEEAHREGLHVAGRRRANALAEQLGSRRAGWRAVAPRLPRTTLVSLSGPGAATDGPAIVELLRRAGVEASLVRGGGGPALAGLRLRAAVLLRAGRAVVAVDPPAVLRPRLSLRAGERGRGELAATVWRFVHGP